MSVSPYQKLFFMESIHSKLEHSLPNSMHIVSASSTKYLFYPLYGLPVRDGVPKYNIQYSQVM